MNKLPTYKNCFVCGQESSIGLKARFYTDGEKAWTEFLPTPEYEGYKGVVHGGIITALLDETMGKAICVVHDTLTMTGKLEIRFRREARVGRKLVAEGRVTGCKGRFYETAGTVRDENGEVIVEAKGMFIAIPPDNAREIESYLE